MNQVSRQLAFFCRHPLTKDRPLAAIGPFLNWQIRSRFSMENEFDWIDGSKLMVRRGMTGATGNIYCGLHEFVDMSFLLHFLRPGELFGDIGANIGSYTVLASAVCNASVLAVEPDPGTAARLRRNIELNHAENRVEVAETAVGGHVGSVRFTMGLDCMNKVSLAGDRSPSRVVPLTTLDRLFHSSFPVMLKFDVEGFEAEVLKGAERVLAADTLIAVQSESRDPEVTGLLHCHGFAETHYNPFSRSFSSEPMLPQSNGLFIRNRPEVEARTRSARRFRVLHHEI